MTIISNKKKKEEHNYRIHEQCSTCVYFFPPAQCEQIEGRVSGDCVCDLWSLKKSSAPYNAEFFQQKLNKEVAKVESK